MSNTELIEAARRAAFDYELRGHDAMSEMMVKVADALEAYEAERASLRVQIEVDSDVAFIQRQHIESLEAERDAALGVIVAYKAAGDDVKRACPECEGEGGVLVDFHYGTVEIECTDCNATGATS